jgi:hypothetical protein
MRWGIGDRKMGAISSMNDTFRFFQKRYTDLILPALEGYLIMLVSRLILTPIMMLIFLPTVFLPFLPLEGLSVGLVVIFVLVFLVSYTGGALAMGILVGGMVRSVDDIRNYRKVNFGDVFKYGWENKWELFTIQFLNYLVILIIVLGISAVFIILGILLFTTSPLAAILFFILLGLLFPFLFYLFFTMMYMPFIIRHRREVRGTENIIMAWKEFFSEPGTYLSMGLLFCLLVMVLSMVPILNIIVSIALHPAIISTLLIHYDEKYGIPVAPPPPPEYPPMQSYPHYQYPQNQQFQQPPPPPPPGYYDYPPGPY